MNTLLVFAKVPLPGFAKSRIAATTDIQRAHRIYTELLQATAQALDTLDYHVCFTGAEDPTLLLPFFKNARSFFPQKGNSLGDRLRHGVNHLLSQGYNGVVSIGCDCPTATKADYRAALSSLKQGAEVVIGPTTDGGYYLIGCTTKSIAVFDATQWSTPLLFEETLTIVKHHRFRHDVLPVKSDIDTFEDYQAWHSSVC